MLRQLYYAKCSANDDRCSKPWRFCPTCHGFWQSQAARAEFGEATAKADSCAVITMKQSNMQGVSLAISLLIVLILICKSI